MKKYIKNFNQHGMYIQVTLILLFVVYIVCFAISDTEQRHFNIHSIHHINKEWTMDNQAFSLPHTVYGSSGKSITLSNQLPDDVTDNMVFFMPSNFCVNELYIDNELRYTYGKHRQLPFGKVIGNILCQAPLNKEDAGKEVRLVLTPQYTRSMEIPLPQYGAEGDVFTYWILKDTWKIIICSVYMAFIIVSILMCIKQKRVQGRRDKTGLLKSYALFTFNSIIWLISSSSIPQIFTDANEAVTLISYLSLSFFAVPYASFCQKLFLNAQKGFTIIAYLGCINTIIILLLYVFNIVDPPQIIYISHLYFVILIVTNIRCIIKERKKNPLVQPLAKAIILLAIFATIGLVLYYKMPTSGYDAVAVVIGFTLFSSMLFAITVSESEKIIQEVVRTDVYRQLAYKDAMTQVGNRAAYENALDFIAHNSSITEQVALVILDLNDLKKINDGIGHQAGDEMIKGLAQCITNAFHSTAHVFRIGGDEFAAICLGKNLNIEALLQNLDKEIETYNHASAYKVSAAYGYAQAKMSAITESNISEFIDTADHNMYENKRKYKEAK